MDYSKVLEDAKKFIDAAKPNASSQKRAAFANSVAYLVTRMSGGFGGPSVREHAASYELGDREWSYGDAVAELQRDDGLIFGPLTPAHRTCFQNEHCFDDDPQDLAELNAHN